MALMGLPAPCVLEKKVPSLTAAITSLTHRKNRQRGRFKVYLKQTFGHHNAVFDYLETGEMPASSTYCGQMLATGGGEDEECTVKDAVPAAEAAWTPP